MTIPRLLLTSSRNLSSTYYRDISSNLFVLCYTNSWGRTVEGWLGKIHLKARALVDASTNMKEGQR